MHHEPQRNPGRFPAYMYMYMSKGRAYPCTAGPPNGLQVFVNRPQELSTPQHGLMPGAPIDLMKEFSTHVIWVAPTLKSNASHLSRFNEILKLITWVFHFHDPEKNASSPIPEAATHSMRKLCCHSRRSRLVGSFAIRKRMELLDFLWIQMFSCNFQ